jgi:CubicO group peptidase (beta-lactamase class C family)
MITRIEQNLQRTSPERQGVASSAVLAFVEALDSQIHELHSFMLLRHGSVIAEGWWSPYGSQHPHLVFSLSKSFTATAIGLAVADGHLSIDDPVLSFFPDETPAEISDFLAAMRVRHLLSMSTGQAVDTWAAMVERADGDWIRGFFTVPVVHPPGTHFVYNTGASYMLSAVLQKATGMKLVDYLQPRLFEPLGISGATWQESPQGITAGGIGLSIRTEDIARFGQLYLQNGMWQGNRILPEAWIAEATASQISNGDDPSRDWTQGYGYQFWRCRHGAYRGDGVFGQYCIVMPEQEAVLAITAGVDVFDMQQPLNLVWEILLPAMNNEPLPENVAAQDSLTAKLSDLALPLVQGRAIVPIASRVSGQPYQVEANDLNIEAITFNFSEAGCIVNARTATGVETISCGYNTWQQGQTNLFNQPLLFDSTPIAASGAWTNEDTFTMVVRLYETPFFHTLVCHFIGDEMMIEVKVNVSLESMKPLLLLARAA